MTYVMATRRIQGSSDESTQSTFLQEVIVLTNLLSDLLDKQRNDALRLQVLSGSPPRNILTQVLSLDSVISTQSSFTNLNQQQPYCVVGYRSIGFGQCGIVYERPGKSYVVKVARPEYRESLFEDFKVHCSVRKAFSVIQNQVKVPMVHSYVVEDSSFWPEDLPLFPCQITPTRALISQQILPLPRIAREALIDQYCPSDEREVAKANPLNRDCLARIYLGWRRPEPTSLSANFTLRNFNLSLDQMETLQLPIHLYTISMAEALAILHWQARIDAYDVEFVLGGEEAQQYSQDFTDLYQEDLSQITSDTDLDAAVRVNFERRATRMWVLDFNLSSMWTETSGCEYKDALIDQLVWAFFSNDPYFPRPHQTLWGPFSASYILKAKVILGLPGRDTRLSQLPEKFLSACVEKQTSM